MQSNYFRFDGNGDESIGIIEAAKLIRIFSVSLFPSLSMLHFRWLLRLNLVAKNK